MRKTIKYAAITIVALLSAQTPINAATAEKEKQQLLTIITDMQAKVFNKENLIVTRITTEDSNDWNKLMGAIRNYVEKYRLNMLPYFNTVSRASNNLMNTLKIVFNSQIVGALKDPEAKEYGLSNLNFAKLNLDMINLDMVEQQINMLHTSRQSLVQFQDELNKKFLMMPTARHTRDVLGQLASTFEMTIDKVFTDFNNFMVSAVLWKKQQTAQ